MITATLEHAGKRTTASAEDVVSAIKKMKSLGVFKIKSVLTVDNGERVISKVLLPTVMNGLFHPSPSIRDMNIKKISMMFN